MEEEVKDPLKKRITTAENSREIVWKNVISEIRHSVFTWGNFFTVLIVGFLPSLFDFGTDYLQAVKFLWGSNYTKHVVNKTDFGNCSHIGRYTSFAGPTPEIVYEEIECFEVVHGQSDEDVEGNDRDHEEEDDEHGIGDCWERHRP